MTKNSFTVFLICVSLTLPYPAYSDESTGVIVPREEPTDIFTASTEEEPPIKRFGVNYFGILFGPAVKSFSSYQPDGNGRADTDRPVIIKNFLGLNYQLSDKVAISGTAFWIWQPVLRQQLSLQDPFVRVSHNSIIGTEHFNLYGDFRIHLPLTRISQDNNMKIGLQTVQVASYSFWNSIVTVGAFGAIRYNAFGANGFGSDLELYVGPNLNIQFLPTLAFTLIYETQNSHQYGDRAFAFSNDSAGIEPGFSWDITPNLMFNPYLHINTSNRINLNSTALGMMLSWNLI